MVYSPAEMVTVSLGSDSPDVVSASLETAAMGSASGRAARGRLRIESIRDLADASLVVAAGRLGTRKVFTLDRRDFHAYRVPVGHRHETFALVG